ncbi:hypothetical protein PR048_019991 [Dryococelus australis]|uniref:Uncharacterized protein n=1 Tax=Dryococelus australis TaxID=614101 RepID=A0ABQ9H5E4_9NEOP|nr:hypothetical protein PR048_019991 [Dryococelus australis]
MRNQNRISMPPLVTVSCNSPLKYNSVPQKGKEQRVAMGCLLKIFGSVRFLVRQGLALQGHESDYTSASIQNEMLEMMAKEIVRYICSKIRS